MTDVCAEAIRILICTRADASDVSTVADMHIRCQDGPGGPWRAGLDPHAPDIVSHVIALSRAKQRDKLPCHAQKFCRIVPILVQ